jgi:hypothetical protein
MALEPPCQEIQDGISMSDNNHIEELKKEWAEQDQLVIEEEYRKLLRTSQGRQLLYHLLSIGGIGKNPFTANALTMSFACGELNVGQRILADILATDAEGWILMQKEATDAYRTRQSILDAG